MTFKNKQSTRPGSSLTRVPVSLRLLPGCKQITGSWCKKGCDLEMNQGPGCEQLLRTGGFGCGPGGAGDHHDDDSQAAQPENPRFSR